MSFTVQNQNIQAQQSFNTQTTSNTQGAQGTLMGQQVTMANDPMSLLASCAEELTFSVDTTDEFEMQERKEKESIDLKGSELYEVYRKMADVQNNDGKDKTNLKNDIKMMQGSKNADTLAKLARDLSGNAAEAYASLQDAYEDLKKEGADPETLKAVNDAIELMQTRDKAEIVACMQAEITANQDPAFAGLKDNTALYTQATQEFLSPKEVYTYIEANYTGKIDTALDFIYKTLANDMSSDMSSMEKSKLTSVNTSLGELRAFQSAHALCDRFVDRLDKVNDIHGFEKTGFEVMGKILNFKDQAYLGSAAIESFAREAKPENPEKEVLFLQELLSITRQFSSTLFDAPQERMKVIDAVQEAVDHAVEREDVWLENM